MFNPNSEAFIPACLFIPQASSSGITLAVDVFSQFTHYRVKHTAHECWSCFWGVVLWGGKFVCRWMNGFVVRGFFPWSSGTIGYMKDREERQSRVPAQSVRPRVVCLHVLVIQPKHCYTFFIYIYNHIWSNHIYIKLFLKSCFYPLFKFFLSAQRSNTLF